LLQSPNSPRLLLFNHVSADLYDSAKPQVLLIGQYSVGKTSFIRYLLGRDFPGQRIGPEPTTDRFTGKDKFLAPSILRDFSTFLIVLCN
jgi:GTPase SAR1 family protein